MVVVRVRSTRGRPEEGYRVLDFDVSSAPQGRSQLLELVSAVVGASSSDEAEWIEWKGALDLASKRDQVAVAKAIVGFANRPPVQAARMCDGRAYVLVGVEPGELRGIEEMDLADLVPRINRYVGDDGPRWYPYWLDVEGKAVLLIEVAAPQPGDPIHHLRKTYEDYADGTIFVRRGASTSPAKSEDVRALELRVRTADRIGGVHVELVPADAVSAVSPAPSSIDGEIERQRARYHQSFERQRAGTDSGPSAVRTAFATSITKATPDPRSEDDYFAQVAAYLQDYREALAELQLAAVLDLLPESQFVATNTSDDYLEDVEVCIHIDGDVSAIDEFDLDPGLPAPPRLFGPVTPLETLSRSLSSPMLNYGLPGRGGLVSPARPMLTIEHGGSVTLKFTPGDLRPEQVVQLEPVKFVFRPEVGNPLSATVSVTARNKRGIDKRDIAIPWSGTILAPDVANLLDE